MTKANPLAKKFRKTKYPNLSMSSAIRMIRVRNEEIRRLRKCLAEQHRNFKRLLETIE